MTDHTARKSELDTLAQALIEKPSLEKVENLIKEKVENPIKEKANKQGVVAALQKKVNTTDFTDIMSQKVDKKDI